MSLGYKVPGVIPAALPVIFVRKNRFDNLNPDYDRLAKQSVSVIAKNKESISL